MASGPAPLAVVSAASYPGGTLAQESLAAAFGSSLGTQVQVQVQDSAGASRAAAVLSGTHSWLIAPGAYQIMAGSSSRDIRLQSQVAMH